MSAAHSITTTEQIPSGRSSVGGMPWLPPGFDVPSCGDCGEPMLLYLQLEIDPEFGLQLASGSQLLIFACPRDNEPNLYRFHLRSKRTKLPKAFWKQTQTGTGLILPPSDEWARKAGPALLKEQGLSFEAFDDEGTPYEDLGILRGAQGFKVGGLPAWYQAATQLSCACGAPMSFVCQVPSDCEAFERAEGAPEQDGTFSYDHYALYLGNSTRVFACSAACTPEAVLLWNE